MRRLKEMQESGVTIFFVSHDLGAIRALCSQAILLHAGHVVAQGKPTGVLSHYQKLIMAREKAYEKRQPDEAGTVNQDVAEVLAETPKLQCAYRHGDGSAEVVRVEFLDSTYRPVTLVETGEAVTVRLYARFHADIEDPVFGFLLRNRHGIHLFGTNTDLQQLQLGSVSRGEVIEVSFLFNCWLAPDSYSVTVAVHSRSAISYDWLDGVVIFQVVSPVAMEGVANLNATATMRRFELPLGQENAPARENAASIAG
jgi:hypothetical protein